MKITKSQLKQIIKEELGKVLSEALDPEKIKLAREDAALDARDDGDRGDRWEFTEPEYLEVYMDAYNAWLEADDMRVIDDEEEEEEPLVLGQGGPPSPEKIAQQRQGISRVNRPQDAFPGDKRPREKRFKDV